MGNALRSVSTAKGINTDKANLLRGEATVRIQHDFTYEQLGAAQRALLESVVDAELVEPAESPEGDQ